MSIFNHCVMFAELPANSTSKDFTLKCCLSPPLQKLAVQPTSTRMGLRSYRSSLPVPMETSSSSSSDDSCDSFGSDGGFANTVSAERGHHFCQTLVRSAASLKIAHVSAVEEHDKTEQEDNGETKDDQGTAGRRRVQRIR